MVFQKDYEFPPSDEIMMKVAQNVGYPKTAFVQAVDDEGDFDVDVRFAKPALAHGFCGHATIALFGFLRNNKIIENGCKYRMRTTVLKENSAKPQLAIIPITFVEDFVEMEQNLPIFYSIRDPLSFNARIAQSLEIPVEFLYGTVEIINTGGKDAIVALKEKENLDIIKLTTEICDNITKVSKEHNIVGFHLFPLNSMSYSWDKDAKGKLNVNVIGVRNFAPLEGFPEEAATGSASGAMACFITKNILCLLYTSDAADE